MKFLFSILLIVASAIMFFWLVNPLNKEVSKLRSEVATYNIALNNSTELQKTRDELIATYSNIKKGDRDRLEHFLPNSVNNIKFILEIEHIANLHSMPIKNVKFQPEEISNTKDGDSTPKAVTVKNDPYLNLPYGTFPIEFTTEGDYNTFSLFLKDIEHNLRLVDVKSIGFAVPSPSDKNTQGVNPNIYTYNLKVETYWLK